MSNEDDEYERKTSNISEQTVENTPVDTDSVTSSSSTTDEYQQVQVDSTTDTGDTKPFQTDDSSSSSGTSNQPFNFSRPLPAVPTDPNMDDGQEPDEDLPSVDTQSAEMLQALGQTLSVNLNAQLLTIQAALHAG